MCWVSVLLFTRSAVVRSAEAVVGQWLPTRITVWPGCHYIESPLIVLSHLGVADVEMC